VAAVFEELQAVARAADARSAELAELRRLPDDLAADLIGSGVFLACVPREFGGDERPFADVLDAIEEAAYWEGSLGWCAMIGATTSLLSGYLPAEWAQRIYGDPRSCTGGYAAPVGRATPVDGGLLVTGTWQWGSGTSHCTYIGGGCRVVDATGAPVPRADGLAAPFLLFEAGDVSLHDNWDVMGLQGSGSVDYEVRDVLVPEGRWVELATASPVAEGPLYRLPFLGALALGVSAVLLGLARRARDELVAIAATKRPAQSSRTLAERAVVQAEVATAEAAYESARAFVRLELGRAWDGMVGEGGPAGALDTERRRRLRLAATNAALRSAEAVDLMYHAAGGSAVFRSGALERVFRDTHVATQHAMVSPRLLEPLGRMALGLPTDTASF
jgi:alkylation response protein AidB-like acyl-CoA dehydrogenase